jgi:cytochrome c oxidase assembly protein subunit 15
LAYLQIVLGSALRHMPVWASPGDFRTALVFHLLVALALAVHIVWLLVRVVKIARHQSALLRPAVGLAALLFVQLGLGLGTWIAKYGWPTAIVPAWLTPTWLAPEGQLDYVVVAEGPVQALLATAHVAVGSLILATSLLVALRSWRLVRGASKATGPVARAMELAL